MKLSEIVARLNLLDSLDVASECATATAKLNHITHVVTEGSDQYNSTAQDIAKTYNEIHNGIAKFSAQVESLKEELRSEIVHTVDVILNRRMRIDNDDDLMLRTHLKNLSDWRLPGMILRPGLENYIEDMVPMDPLYVVDHDPELMRPAVSKFTPEYQRRLRKYVIDDRADGPVLDQLPDNQFGAIFAYHYFNHKPIPIICKFLTEFYQKLRPGGSVIMTYNNCDLAHGVIRAESAWMLYTPKRLIKKHAAELGFELITAHDGAGDVSWLELRKPGDIVSLRGGQTLAKIVAKTD